MPTLLETLTNKKSTHRFALVVQGGGMRGVYSAGVLACFDYYKLQDRFIAVTGSAAGALNAGYFLAEQPGAVNIYTSLLASKSFVDLGRRAKRVDIDYMIDNALHDHFPIDIETLKKAKPAFDIVLTDADTGKKVILDQHGSFAKIYEEFRATTALPVLYDRKIPVKDGYFIDGGVSDLLPVDVASRHSPTDIIVIMTRPLGFYTKRSLFKPTVKKIIRQAAKYQSAAVRDMLPTNEKLLHQNIQAISSGHIGNAAIHLITPKSDIGVGLASIDSTKLEAAGEAGWRDAETFLHHEFTTQESYPIEEQLAEPEPETIAPEPVIDPEDSRYMEETPISKN